MLAVALLVQTLGRRSQFVPKGTSPALHCEGPPDLLVSPQPNSKFKAEFGIIVAYFMPILYQIVLFLVREG